MPSSANDLLSEIRVFYNALVVIGEKVHEDSDITLGGRAVLEYVLLNGPQTVPRVAEARRVTRQRIQSIVNELKEKKLVEAIKNPASQRSPLIQLSRKGTDLINSMHNREATILKDISLSNNQLTTLTRQLRKVRTELELDH
jgi:DNA-binding MarR family transcriptional regulator